MTFDERLCDFIYPAAAGLKFSRIGIVFDELLTERTYQLSSSANPLRQQSRLSGGGSAAIALGQHKCNQLERSPGKIRTRDGEAPLVSTKESLASLNRLVPELPVTDVVRAQEHYRDVLGFEIGWLYPNGEIGAVSRGAVTIFFRKRTPPFEAAVHWVYAEDIDGTYGELQSCGANIVEPLEEKPWGLRQFTVEDIDGNRFYFHHG